MKPAGTRERRAAVVVLGDLGYSPRMQYHALGLAHAGVHTILIGYLETALPRELQSHPLVSIFALRRPARQCRGYTSRLIRRIVRERTQLWEALFGQSTPPDLVIAQTPPAVPLLSVLRRLKAKSGTRVVLDWHNLSAPMLALRMGNRHPLVKIVDVYERIMSRTADLHICVSSAMHDVLRERVGTGPAPIVLRDMPPSRGVPAEHAERSSTLRALAERYKLPQLARVIQGSRRCVLIVSPTSWSLDEDMSMIITAAQRYEEAAARDMRLPDLVVMATGTGPGRAEFEARASSMRLAHVSICTAWLEPEDYRFVLRAADAGLCLHRSASGVDLPMKNADMLGAGLPVCALNYGPVLREQLSVGINSLLFDNAVELGALLIDLMDGFVDGDSRLARLRKSTAATTGKSWENEWNDVVGNRLRQMLEGG